MKNIKDALGQRMKNNYEDAYRIKLPRRMPLIIRSDGRAFHTLTRSLEKPFDNNFIAAMFSTAQYLCENCQNIKLAYWQSDEISLLLTDYDTLTTESFFDSNLQKIVSVTAAMATLAFNKKIKEFYPDKEGVFDARAFVLPIAEVNNYFLWRANDASRNSIQMIAQANFSHKELQNLSCNKLQDKLMLERGINYNDIETHKKRGACVIKKHDPITGRSSWVVDLEIPLFSVDRDYINRLIEPEEV